MAYTPSPYKNYKKADRTGYSGGTGGGSGGTVKTGSSYSNVTEERNRLLVEGAASNSLSTSQQEEMVRSGVSVSPDPQGSGVVVTQLSAPNYSAPQQLKENISVRSQDSPTYKNVVDERNKKIIERNKELAQEEATGGQENSVDKFNRENNNQELKTALVEGRVSADTKGNITITNAQPEPKPFTPQPANPMMFNAPKTSLNPKETKSTSNEVKDYNYSEENSAFWNKVYESSPAFGVVEGVKYAFKKPDYGYNDIPVPQEVEERNVRLQSQEFGREGFAGTLIMSGTTMTSLGFGESQVARGIVDKEYVKPLKKYVSEQETGVAIVNPDLLVKERALALATTKSLKAAGFKGGDDMLPAIVVRPLESVSGVSQTTNVKGFKQQESFVIISKGSPEVVKSMSDIDVPEFVVIEGTKTSSNVPFVNPPGRTGAKLISDDSLLQIGQGPPRASPPSKGVFPGVSKVENVKGIMTSQEFGVQTSPNIKYFDTEVKGVKVTVDNQNAIFKGQRLVTKGDDNILYSKTEESFSGSIQGFNPKSEASSKPDVFGYKRIAREKVLRNDVGIEDMRNRIEFNAVKPIPFEGSVSVSFAEGTVTKIYSFDKIGPVATVVRPSGKAAAFSFVIPKSVVMKTFSDSSVASAGFESSGGYGQSTVTLQEPKVESVNSPLSTVTTTSIADTKSKSKSKSESKSEQVFKMSSGSGSPEPKVYANSVRSGQPGGFSIFERPDVVIRRKFKVDTKGDIVPVFVSDSRSDTSSGLASASASGVASGVGQSSFSGVAFASASGSMSGLAIGQSQSQGQSVSQSQSQSTVQVSRQVNKFRFNRDYDSPDPNPRVPKFVVPPFNFGNQNEGGLFAVDVRRRGRFSTVASGVGIVQAFSIGKVQVGGSAAASFRVRALNQKGSAELEMNKGMGFGRGLYASKREEGVFIEKPSYRIKSSGEVSEISLKGVASQRRKRRGGLL